MLQNAYLLAKIGADTAENERKFAEHLPKIGNYPGGVTRVAAKILDLYGRVSDPSAVRVRDVLIGTAR